jgi:hypothetical protein
MSVGASGTELQGAGRTQRRHQAVLALEDGRREQFDVLTANAVTGESYQHARFSIDSKAHSAADAAVTPEPFEARLRAPRQILVMDEEVLEQLEPR